MAMMTALYNKWVEESAPDADMKELKFGLAAFTAGYNLAKKEGRLHEEIHQPGPNDKKIALVTASNDKEEVKLIIGYDTTIDNMFDNFEEMAESVLYSTFGDGCTYKVKNVTEMSVSEFKNIVGERMASRAWYTMEQRPFFYTVVSKNIASAYVTHAQIEDEADDDIDKEYYDFI